MAEQIPEGIEILDSDSNVTITLDGEKAHIGVGAKGKEGGVFVRNDVGEQTFSAGAGGGDIIIYQKIDGVTRAVLRFDASSAGLFIGHTGRAGSLVVHNSAGEQAFQVVGDEGDIVARRKIGGVLHEVMKFDASNAALVLGSVGNAGDIVIRNSAGDDTFQVDGRQGDIYVRQKIDGVSRNVLRFDASDATLYLGNEGNEGDIIMRNSAGDKTFQVDGAQGDIYVRQKIDGVMRNVLRFDATAAALYVGSQGNEGDIIVRDGDARNVFHFDSSHAALYLGAAGNEGDVIVRDGAGTERIRLDGASGDIQLSGADCAEDFDILSGFEAEPGMIMVIDSEDTLRPCDSAYDKRVAGVISGAGGMTPGITLDKQERSSTRRPLSLAGKAFCKADAAYGPIQIGDLLTTSPTSGHAMKADDPLQAFGAVIGKALRPLTEGKGLIPILVSLQ